jgi:hypothetical protein
MPSSAVEGLARGIDTGAGVVLGGPLDNFYAIYGSFLPSVNFIDMRRRPQGLRLARVLVVFLAMLMGCIELWGYLELGVTGD